MNARDREKRWFPVGGGRDGEPTAGTAAAGRRLSGDVENRGGEAPLYTHTREQEKGERERVVSATARAAKRLPAIDQRPAPWPVTAWQSKEGGSRRYVEEGGVRVFCPLFPFYVFFCFAY